jgi:hypothetical protein
MEDDFKMSGFAEGHQRTNNCLKRQFIALQDKTIPKLDVIS